MVPSVLLSLSQLAQAGSQISFPERYKAVPCQGIVPTMTRRRVLVQPFPSRENVGMIAHPTRTGLILAFRGRRLTPRLCGLGRPAVLPPRVGV